MNISGAGSTSLLDSVLTAENTRVEIGVAVMKKAKDLQEQEGAAMVKLIEQAAPQAQGLDTYA